MSLRSPALFPARGLLRGGGLTSKAQALGRLPLLAGLGRGDLERLAQMTEDLDLSAGKVLCREGGTADQFFLIVEGEVEVTKGGEFVRRLGRGEFFGETGLIERTPLGTS